MNKLEKLNNLKLNAMSIVKSVLLYMRALQPLNNPVFMNPEEKKMYDSYVVIINKLNKEYTELFGTLTPDEMTKHQHMNILAEFNSAVRELECIEMVYDGDDEYELKDKFAKAYKYGKRAIEDKIDAEKRNDQVTILNCNRILAACDMVFKKHSWGQGYITDLEKYEERLRSGRTVDDDLRDYEALYEETVELSIKYAHALIDDAPEEERRKLYESYEPIYERADDLLKFVPFERLKDINTNAIRWLRIHVQSNPSEFLEKFSSFKRLK